jgi:hypothetical protein
MSPLALTHREVMGCWCPTNASSCVTVDGAADDAATVVEEDVPAEEVPGEGVPVVFLVITCCRLRR